GRGLPYAPADRGPERGRRDRVHRRRAAGRGAAARGPRRRGERVVSAAGAAAERAAGPPAALRRRIRALAAAAAVALPLLLWAAVVPIGGHPLEVSSGMRTGALAPQTMELGAAPFAVVSLLSALLGWALL